MAARDRLNSVVSVRFTDQEADELRALAGDRPVSHVVRELALEALRRPGSRPAFHPTVSSPGNVEMIVTTTSATRQGPILGVVGLQDPSTFTSGNR